VTVGSNSNVGENGIAAEEERAAIWEVDPRAARTASSPVRPAQPERHGLGADSGALWTAVNERDELGSDLVPDYLTSVRDGGFYGWPYSYYGQHVDERVKPQRPTWWPKRDCSRLRARPAHRFARPGVYRPASAAARGLCQRRMSSASTARGTAGRTAATRSSSCRSRMSADRRTV
jgi:glucose/arabinose dehydrogenase